MGLRKSLPDGGEEVWKEILPNIAMGYRITQQMSLSYGPVFLMFDRGSIFQADINATLRTLIQHR